MKTGLLQSDPTIFYAHDTLKLAEMKFPDWTKYVFWDRCPTATSSAKPLPDEIAGYNTYKQPWPAARARSPRRRSSHRRGARARTRRRATCSSSRRATAGRARIQQDARRARAERRASTATELTGRAATGGLPEAADFAPPPDATTRRRWTEADRAPPARAAAPPPRADGRRRHRRLLRHAPGAHALADRVRARRGRGQGRRPLGPVPRRRRRGDPRSPTRGTRSRRAARRPTPSSTRSAIPSPPRGPALLARVGARRVALEAAVVPHALWTRLEAAAPDVELVPVERLARGDRATKTPDEIERVAAACAVADRALATLLPEIRAGVTEHDLALRLEWLIRTGGAEALAFDVACLAGPEAALPHGTPGDRPVLDGAVLLFDFGAQVDGLPQRHDPDAVRRRAAARDLACTTLVRRGATGGHRRARGARVGDDAAAGRAGARRARPRGDRGRRPLAGLRPRPRARIGLATHELPRLGRTAPERRRCRAPRCSRWSPASTSRARPASGSRTSSTSTPRAASSSR